MKTSKTFPPLVQWFVLPHCYFEQAINIPSFKNKRNEDVGRVTFGTGYLRHSFLELYLLA